LIKFQLSERWECYEETNVTEEHKEERGIARNVSRPQDFLMPGLRHAHTLQQLKNYSNITSLVMFYNLLSCHILSLLLLNCFVVMPLC